MPHAILRLTRKVVEGSCGFFFTDSCACTLGGLNTRENGVPLNRRNDAYDRGSRAIEGHLFLCKWRNGLSPTPRLVPTSLPPLDMQRRVRN